MSDFHFITAHSTAEDPDQALQALLEQIRTGMETRLINLAVAFLSPHFMHQTETIVTGLNENLPCEVLLGCTAEGVISQHAEWENTAAISVVVGSLPRVQLTPFSLSQQDLQTSLKDPLYLQTMLAAPDDTRLFLILADPFTAPIDKILPIFNMLYPDLPVVGGLASASLYVGGNTIFLNETQHHQGVVGVALSGPVDADVIVSQGCRPIGQPVLVTQAKENIILSLENEQPLLFLRLLIDQLSADEQRLIENGFFIGRAINTDDEAPGRGDFLVRSVLGLDRQTGSLIIGDQIEAGETIQFHVRDAATAEEDLEMMLSPQLFYEPPAGGLLFSCNGRGRRLYPHPNGDISLIQKVLGDVPLAGFFCAGEIGPIGRQNFLHGHTASIVLFRPRPEGK